MADNRFVFRLVVSGSVEAESEADAQEVIKDWFNFSTGIWRNITKAEVECSPVASPQESSEPGPEVMNPVQGLLEKMDQGFDAVSGKLQEVGESMVASNASIAHEMREIVGGLRDLTGSSVLQKAPDRPAPAPAPAPASTGRSIGKRSFIRTVPAESLERIPEDEPESDEDTEVPPEEEEEESVGNSASSPPPEPAPRRPGRRSR
jgi:hypothetical protein